MGQSEEVKRSVKCKHKSGEKSTCTGIFGTSGNVTD